MAIAKITMIGFYNYLAHENEDLFEFLSVPEGIDKDTLVNNILLRGGEFEVLYSEPAFFKNMIGVWSNKWQRTMQRWINALSIDYNPLENYDRMEDWEDNGSKVSAESKKNDASAQRTNVSQNSLTDAKTNSDNTINSENAINSDKQERSENAVAMDHSTSAGDGTTTNTRSAYDSPGYQPHDKSESITSGENISNGITNANGTTSTNGTTTNNALTSTQGIANGTANALNQTMGTDAETGSQTANAVDKTNGVHSGRIHGNIGVTTSQAMLTAELDISKWNIYEEITNLFLSEFCIYLY